MTNHFGQFNREIEEEFRELADERYNFGSCKSGEKMTFGKCQKVGGSGKKPVPQSLKDSKAAADAQLATAKKTGNKGQIFKAQRKVDNVNKQLDAYNASEDEPEFKSGCPDGFRSKGSQTISGKRREVCCTPDGRVCMTADGIPL